MRFLLVFFALMVSSNAWAVKPKCLDDGAVEQALIDVWATNSSPYSSLSIPQKLKKAEGVYHDFSEVAGTVLALCPPSNCHTIMIGRSPTYLSAIFDEILTGFSTKLPLSFHHPSKGLLNLPLSPALKKELYAHFDRFLDLKTLKGKKIMIVDGVGGTQQSLLNAQQVIAEYLAERGVVVTKQPSVFAFGHIDKTNSLLKKAHEQGIEAYSFGVKTNDRFYDEALPQVDWQMYDDLAAYPSYRLGFTDPATMKPNPNYDKLRKTVRAQMQHDIDPTVSKYIKKSK
jgi:hypothetical protein